MFSVVSCKISSVTGFVIFLSVSVFLRFVYFWGQTQLVCQVWQQDSVILINLRKLSAHIESQWTMVHSRGYFWPIPLEIYSLIVFYIFEDWLWKDVHDGYGVWPEPDAGGDRYHPTGGGTPLQRHRGTTLRLYGEKRTTAGLQGQRTVHGGEWLPKLSLLYWLMSDSTGTLWFTECSTNLANTKGGLVH